MLKSEKVLLRPVRRADLQLFLKWFNDPEVTHYLWEVQEYEGLSLIGAWPLPLEKVRRRQIISDEALAKARGYLPDGYKRR